MAQQLFYFILFLNNNIIITSNKIMWGITTSTIVFVPPANNVETENTDVKNELASENVDKGKSILGAPPKLDKKEIKNSRAKKGKVKGKKMTITPKRKIGRNNH